MAPKKQDLATRFWSKVDKSGECWEWTAAFLGGGYGGFKFNRKMHKAHRMSYELTYGQIPSGLIVCHSCDNRRCVRPDHLWVGTTADNVRDRVQKGRSATGDKITINRNTAKGQRNGTYTHPEKIKHGEENGFAKLTAKQVLEIRELYAGGKADQKQLAAHYGVNQPHISRIIRRECWKHI